MASKSQCPVILSFLLPWTSSEAIDRGQEYEYGYQLYDEGVRESKLRPITLEEKLISLTNPLSDSNFSMIQFRAHLQREFSQMGTNHSYPILKMLELEF